MVMLKDKDNSLRGYGVPHASDMRNLNLKFKSLLF